MTAITPFLWFDDKAQEAAAFYVSLFADAEILATQSQAGPDGADSVTLVTFRLENQRFTALNGGPHYRFSAAVSFFIDCPDQPAIDALWDRLVEGGEALRCGWLTDRYGLTWQIVPTRLGDLLGGPDRARAGRVMQAMLKMIKLDVAALEAA